MTAPRKATLASALVALPKEELLNIVRTSADQNLVDAAVAALEESGVLPAAVCPPDCPDCAP